MYDILQLLLLLRLNTVSSIIRLSSISTYSTTTCAKRAVYAVRLFNHAVSLGSWEALDRTKASLSPLHEGDYHLHYV